MFAESIYAENYRNLTGKISLSQPLAVIVGENNAGKSTVIDALRLVFESTAGPKGQRWLSASDFKHDGRGNRVADNLRISVVLGGLTEAERGRMVTCLAPKLGKDKAIITLSAVITASGRIETEWLGGDLGHSKIEKWARSAITQTFLHPLRDAAADLRPGRDNKLVGLVSTFAPIGHSDRTSIQNIATKANDDLQKVAAISESGKRIQERLDGLTGPSQFTQRSNLGFAPPEFAKVVASLQAQVGHGFPLSLEENGLGYNNLLYMATLLAALSDPHDSLLNLLLIEEPEAHLHPQLQDLLMSYLEKGNENTQIVVTSHSPQFASSAKVEKLTVLARSILTGDMTSSSPQDANLSSKELKHLRRFLDVTKASLFFSRGVILVEGIAEQLLVPVLAKRAGLDLSHHGVSVINVGGLAFAAFAALFNEETGLPFPCAILSDSDPKAGVPISATAQALLRLNSSRVMVRLSRQTFEWDLAITNESNRSSLISALSTVKPQVGLALTTASETLSPEEFAGALLSSVQDQKGRFAQELTAILDDMTVDKDFQCPNYILDAVRWACSVEKAAR